MPPGRPTTKPQPELGKRIASARQEKGLTQMQLAGLLDTTQRVVTYWERETVALKPDQLIALADALDVSTDYLLGRNVPAQRGAGPKGRAKEIFEAVSKLPRSQQEKVFAVLEPFVNEHRAS